VTSYPEESTWNERIQEQGIINTMKITYSIILQTVTLEWSPSEQSELGANYRKLIMDMFDDVVDRVRDIAGHIPIVGGLIHPKDDKKLTTDLSVQEEERLLKLAEEKILNEDKIKLLTCPACYRKWPEGCQQADSIRDFGICIVCSSNAVIAKESKQ
jgi:hypothetical protein